MKTREDALALLKQYNESDQLVHHALCVEAVMKHFAKRYGDDEDYWAMVGLLHDLDYEKYPDEHTQMTEKILREEGYDEDFIRAISSHGYGLVNEVKPEKNVEKVLYTIDELTGLINATALMRPSKSVMDLEVKSVKKKFKQASFASGVNREVILQGAEMLGMSLDEVIHESILGMRSEAEALGLN